MFADFSLHERLLKALEAEGLTQPTPVQAQAIPLALSGRDLLVSAETGSGKTAAYLLPMLDRFLREKAPGSATRGLILVPTRELARQVLKQFKLLAGLTPLQAGAITGGAEFKYQAALLRKNPEVLVATPGRLIEHLDRGTVELGDLEVLVIDEADRMLDLGFSEDVLKLADACRRERQTLLLSATLDRRGLSDVAGRVLREPEKLLLSGARDQHENIHQQIVLADDFKHKSRLLVRLLQEENFDKALVFTNTKAQADKLCGLLRYHQWRAGVLHGDLTQDERNRVMDLLRRGSIQVLVATDVAARGLDVKGIDLVVSFDMARSGDEHVHRVGRTGRAGAQGLAICLISASEWNLMAGIERYLRISFERRTVAGLTGKYKGPEKLKRSGKAAALGKRKPRTKSADKDKKAEKVKQRHRDRKQIGKRRAPSGTGSLGDGFAPLKKPRRSDPE
ncbi:DEAD/DEAH box helicase [Motiliproteus sp. SC1-56]|uniref:DEAD/DEAH box helicase n=1 Tax=Motiliproteus sp. SC1-56 TaxID=2799565 RepID=UPI001A8DE498|nr:DEAD/DEAH box helicase [Motiliproteus sp. SC1-56]